MNYTNTHTILIQFSDPLQTTDEDIQDGDLEHILELIHDYLQDHYALLADPNFEELLVSDLIKLVGVENTDSEDTLIDLETDIHKALVYFYSHFMPRRSFHSSFIFKNPDVERMEQHIQFLQSIPQPAQRTPEWYEFRHNLITASDLYKAVDSVAVQNSLIYAKCNPWKSFAQCTNVNSSLHWGQKYEPLSVMLYEYIYQTKISELGCLRHPKYPFLGASPDGINTCKDSPLYGRLLEIKNVVSREIDGVPKKEYWIQMQSQMEVCDIDECDFLETKFTEYDCYMDYIADDFKQYSQGDIYLEKKSPPPPPFDGEEDDDDEKCRYPFKGTIIMFSSGINGNPYYVFKPLEVPLEEEEQWSDKVIDEQTASGNMWVRNIYWKLEVFSCVLVLRNKFWFEKSLSSFSAIWDTIEKERVTGWEHRAPKRKTSTQDSEIIKVVKLNS